MEREEEVKEEDEEILSIETINDGVGKYEETTKAKVSLVESIIFILIVVSADALEIWGAMAAATLLGMGIGVIAFFYGIFVSLVIIIWSFLRNVNGSFVIKLAVRRSIWLIGGSLLDAMTLGILPIRTIVLIITIILNNKLTDRQLGKIFKKMESLSSFEKFGIEEIMSLIG